MSRSALNVPRHQQHKRDILDAWVIFEHLYSAQRTDLIEYLIHQLYYLSNDDIDFFLPQLCTLLVVRSGELSSQLECFILHKCMKSIDFAIKCFWNLHAMQFYSKVDSQHDRCEELRQNLEMIVVNGQLPHSLLAKIPANIRKSFIDPKQPLSPNQLNVNGNANSNAIQSNGHVAKSFSPSHNGSPSPNGDMHSHSLPPPKPPSSPALSSALPKPKVPNNLPNHHDPLLNGATEYLKKQRRCTYFNAELDFAHFLEGVSSALEQCDREDRPRLLEDNIRYANKCLPRGLYIPINKSASDKHQSLLRIVQNEGKCLDSKQKVPFLLFCEVEEHSYPTSSPQICEELTESESALLSSSGLYVLIDEHRKRKERDQKRHRDRERDKKKKAAPNRLKKAATIKKPNKMRRRSSLSVSKSKSSQLTKNRKSKPISNDLIPPSKALSPSESPTPDDPANSQSLSCRGPEDYSVSRDPEISDEEEMKRSRTHSDNDSNEQTEEQSMTMSTQNGGHHNVVDLSSIPVPQPKPKDMEAEDAMKRHLERLKAFEPSDHKAVKSPNSKYGGNGSNHLLSAKDRRSDKSSSSSKLNRNPSLLSPTARDRQIGRSRTPEPDKRRSKRLHPASGGGDQSYLSKSDGNCSSESSPSTTENEESPKRQRSEPDFATNGGGANGKMSGGHNHKNEMQRSHSAMAANSVNSNHDHGHRVQNGKESRGKALLGRNGNNNLNGNNNGRNAIPSASATPSVVIYRHPNYETQKSNKLKYLRGKSMQWKDPFGEPWDKRSQRYREQSPFKHHENWSMQSVIFKSGEDMRQEQMAMQFIRLFNRIWTDAKLPLQLQPYSVVVTSPASGFVETVPNSTSISRLKHAVTNFVSLRKFFEQFYGPPGSPGFQIAQKNFVESMAGYSLVCYFLQIKDRHNGNILLTSEGRVVHIDFDFLFSNSPGGNIGFESAPFKLTEEYIEVMGGEEQSEAFDYFKILLIRGFLEARKHVRKFVLMTKVMMEGSPMPCFLAGPAVIGQLEERFATKLKNEKCVEWVYNLIEESSCNWRSVQYDKFQRITNNIL